MLTYSVAIRTLGTSGEKFDREILSLTRQSVPPERIVVYLAEGYEAPAICQGRAQVVTVAKGMVRQRALRYDEISSDCILLLDDDVELAPDSAHRLLTALEQNQADCVAADTFHNQDMSVAAKVYSALTGMVFPHWSKRWAFKIHRNAAFSYNNRPRPGFYESQSAAGPCSLWRKKSLLQLHWEDEVWVERFGFGYGDDLLEFNKLYRNGGKLGVLYGSGVKNLDAKSSSADFQKQLHKFYVRSWAQTCIWYRICYDLRGASRWQKFLAASAYAFKCLWLLPINLAASLKFRTPKVFTNYLRGIRDALKYVHSEEYKRIPSFIVKR